MKAYNIQGRLGNLLFLFAHIYSDINKAGCKEYSVDVCPIDINKLKYKPLILESKNFEGYFESEQYFDSKLIKKLYSPTEQLKKEIQDRYGNLSKSLFIAVRRGDFLNLCDKFIALNENYYKHAFDLLLEKNTYDKIIITSDNMEWCKRHLNISGNVIYLDNESPMNTIMIGSCCKDFIISASTFAWWCAWLGEKPGSTIICPSEKYKPGFNEVESKIFFPDRWLKIDCRQFYENFGHGIALCAIGKLENNYIREWVEYYKKIGIDHIYLYDNNNPDGERFEEVILDYIDLGLVTIIDFRGRKICLMNAYNDCYETYGYKYDWICFFDCDEFLEIENNFLLKGNVKRFLSLSIFKDYNIIKINWKTFTDSGIISPKGNYSIKKFTEFILDRNSRHNKHSKCIVRTRKRVSYTNSVHVPKGKDAIICNVFGKPENLLNETKNPAIWVRAWINHYKEKTIEEFILNKMLRLYPDHDDEYSKNLLNIDYFFRSNKRTPEKETYAKELLKQFE